MTRDYSQFFSSTPADRETDRHLSPLEALGWQNYFAQQIGIAELSETPPVRVVEVHRNALHVIGDAIDADLPPRSDATVGDWLLLDSQTPAQSRLLERKSLIKRRAPGSDRNVQLIAANVDTIFVVSSCNQDFNIARLERYIALSFDAGADPVIVLTKADLVQDASGYIDRASAISDRVTVVTLDARDDEPRSKLAEWCRPGRTVALLGSSGVGKSTLANALSGTQSIATQAIREDDAKGRHTTTRRQLHRAENGCLILDTPGMRELQLTDAAAGIEDVFADLHHLSQQCRFRDCQHETEPGCAVQQAVADGEIDQARLTRWRKLLAEEAFNSASLAERRSKDKAFGKMVRRIMREKDQRR